MRMCSAYHLQIDGQSEVINRVVEMILRCLMHESKEFDHWETILTIFEWIYPFFLNYDYHLFTLMNVLRAAKETTIEIVN